MSDTYTDYAEATADAEALAEELAADLDAEREDREAAAEAEREAAQEARAIALEAATARVADAADTLTTGPERIAEALEMLRAEVTTYKGAYSILAALDAVADAPQPGRLAGVRAVEALAPKPRRSRAKSSAA